MNIGRTVNISRTVKSRFDHAVVYALGLCFLAAALVALASCGGSTGKGAEDSHAYGTDAPTQSLSYPDEPFRRRQPGAAAIRPFQAPKVAQFRLDNGIEVYLVQHSQIPTLTMELTFEGGSADDPKGKEGMAELCVELLGQGTQKLPKIEFEEALANLGSSISTFADVDQIGVTVSTLIKNLKPSLALWGDTLRRPGLRETEFNRLMQSQLTTLLQIRAAPTGVSARVGDSLVFGLDHPQGEIVTERSLKSVTLADCKSYLAQRIRPNRAKLFAVGDISVKELQQHLQRQFFGWYGAPTKAPVVGEPKPRPGRIFFIDIPGAQQAVVKLMHVGPPRKAPDYFSTTILSAILGGSFSSRINMVIREKKGYSYGASGRYYYTRNHGYFLAKAEVRNDVAGAAVSEILREIITMKNESATDEELKREIEGTILALPAMFTRGTSILDTIQSLVYYRLPLNYYDTYIQNVQAVTRSGVAQAAQKYLHPDQLKVLVVGDGATVASQLTPLLRHPAFAGSEVIKLDRDGNKL